VEETVSSQLREKHGDKLQRIQGVGYEVDAIYDELFSFACPKFITPSTPNWDEPPVNFNQARFPSDFVCFGRYQKEEVLSKGAFFAAIHGESFLLAAPS
jgi:translation initiation factor 3 subunit L